MHAAVTEAEVVLNSAATVVRSAAPRESVYCNAKVCWVALPDDGVTVIKMVGGLLHVPSICQGVVWYGFAACM